MSPFISMNPSAATGGQNINPMQRQVDGGYQSYRAVQAGVTLNVMVDQFMPTVRKLNPYELNQKKKSRYGPTLSGGKDYSIDEMDLVFLCKDASMCAGKQVMSDGRPYGFSVFNGIKLNGIVAQEDFESKFKFLGVAKTNYVVGDKSRLHNTTGVATHLRGGGISRVNDGIFTINVGDRVKHMLLPISEDAQIMMKENLPSIPLVDKNRYKAFVMPADPLMDMWVMFRSSYKEIKSSPNMRIERVHMNTVLRRNDKNKVNEAPISKKQYIGLTLFKENGLMNLWLGLTVLSQAGLVTINRSAFKDLDAKKVPLKTTGRSDYEDLGWLACKLGLVNSKPREEDDYNESPILVDQVLARQYVSMMPKQEMEDNTLNSAFDLRINGINGPLSSNGLSEYAMILLNKFQKEFPKDIIDGFRELKNLSEHNYFATAMNTSEPGQIIDLMIN